MVSYVYDSWDKLISISDSLEDTIGIQPHSVLYSLPCFSKYKNEYPLYAQFLYHDIAKIG